jgi:hypothetical protein
MIIVVVVVVVLVVASRYEVITASHQNHCTGMKPNHALSVPV